METSDISDWDKRWISTRGPLEACFSVYSDFFAYKSGIYKHVSGDLRGGHCICCVGYNDTEQYWIMKNSGGTGFGESGYFRIAYGECGIDSWMDAIEGIAERDGQETMWLANLNCMVGKKKREICRFYNTSCFKIKNWTSNGKISQWAVSFKNYLGRYCAFRTIIKTTQNSL